MLVFRAATMGDIHVVFSDLSAISSAEVVAECGNWWKALPRALKLLALYDSQTEALIDKSGTALAIFGHYPSREPLVRTTWFVFSGGFEARGLAVALACRRRVGALLAAYPETCFRSFTRSDHPERDRWFAMLGFDFIGTSYNETGDTHCYVLVGSDKSSDLSTDDQYNPEHPRAS